jgi:hypothetical protein
LKLVFINNNLLNLILSWLYFLQKLFIIWIVRWRLVLRELNHLLLELLRYILQYWLMGNIILFFKWYYFFIYLLKIWIRHLILRILLESPLLNCDKCKVIFILLGAVVIQLSCEIKLVRQVRMVILFLLRISYIWNVPFTLYRFVPLYLNLHFLHLNQQM